MLTVKIWGVHRNTDVLQVSALSTNIREIYSVHEVLRIFENDVAIFFPSDEFSLGTTIFVEAEAWKSAHPAQSADLIMRRLTTLMQDFVTKNASTHKYDKVLIRVRFDTMIEEYRMYIT
jgi:hypothetical protein